MIRFRPDGLTPYRLLFIGIFMLLGIAGISTSYLGEASWLFTYLEPAGRDLQAITAACGIGGTVSLLYDGLLLYMITERRLAQPDRRRQSAAIAFADRRSGLERREVRQEEKYRRHEVPHHPHAA